MDQHEIAVTVHTTSSVNVAEFAPDVSDGVDVCLRANIDLARRITAHIDFPSTFRRLEDEGYRGYYTMAFGSLDDELAARKLFRGYGI